MKTFHFCQKPILSTALVQFFFPIVAGPIEPKNLGVVLPHEHLLLDFQCSFRDAEYGNQSDISDLTIELKNLGKIRHFPCVE